MKRTPGLSRLVPVVAAAFAFIVHPAAAHAQFTKEELKCRTTISKNGSKLATTTNKVVNGCHKGRIKDKVDAMDDCNDIQTADSKNKIGKAGDKLADAVGGAKDKCAGITPADLDYDECPAPCDSVGALTTFALVSECLTCLAETRIADMTTAALGMPAMPMPGKDEEKCHGAVAKNQAKYVAAVLKERTKCQSSAEKGGAIETSGCEPGGNAAVDIKIGNARDKAQAGIEKACAAVQPDFAAIDSCEAGSNLSALVDCVLDDADDVANELFSGYYQLGPTLPFTWTEIQTLFSASCSGLACHTNGQGAGGLTDLDLYDEGYDSLVTSDAVACPSSSFAERVLAGDPDMSFLMEKLDQTLPDCGSRMPLGGPFLSDGVRERIRLWILGGAPKN